MDKSEEDASAELARRNQKTIQIRQQGMDLGVARVIKYPSTSRPGQFHYTFIYDDQRGVQCSCEGHQYHGHCKHVDALSSEQLNWHRKTAKELATEVDANTIAGCTAATSVEPKVDRDPGLPGRLRAE